MDEQYFAWCHFAWGGRWAVTEVEGIKRDAGAIEAEGSIR